MNEYRTEVTIIVDDQVRDNEISFGVLNDLEEYGLAIDSICHENGTVQGTISTGKAEGLKERFGVSYVRHGLTYHSVREGDE